MLYIKLIPNICSYSQIETSLECLHVQVYKVSFPSDVLAHTLTTFQTPYINNKTGNQLHRSSKVTLLKDNPLYSVFLGCHSNA